MNTQIKNKTPLVTAQKMLEYKREFGHVGDLRAPETALVCYQRSTMDWLRKEHSKEIVPFPGVSHFFLLPGGKAGILGDWGVGAPGLAIKMEELIALGTKRFVAIGTAGALGGCHSIASYVLCPKALAEDGVAHHYLPEGKSVAEASPELLEEWKAFAKRRALPEMSDATAWSFSAFFRETAEDVLRVSSLGCSVVEMEAATLYAIAEEKNVQAISLFVISDSISEEGWTPRLREPATRNHLHLLANWALEFCMENK